MSQCFIETGEKEREGPGNGVNVVVRRKGWCMGVWVRIVGEGTNRCREIYGSKRDPRVRELRE